MWQASPADRPTPIGLSSHRSLPHATYFNTHQKAWTVRGNTCSSSFSVHLCAAIRLFLRRGKSWFSRSAKPRDHCPSPSYSPRRRDHDPAGDLRRELWSQPQLRTPSVAVSCIRVNADRRSSFPQKSSGLGEQDALLPNARTFDSHPAFPPPSSTLPTSAIEARFAHRSLLSPVSPGFSDPLPPELPANHR